MASPNPLARLRDAAFSSVDASWAALFRVTLGAGLFVRIVWLVLANYDGYLHASKLHVPYYGFEWIPVSPWAVQFGLFATLITSALMTLGRAPRLMSALSLLFFGYFFIVDRTNFSNLNYATLWLLLWACFMPLGQRASLDQRRLHDQDPSHTSPEHMPRWHLWTARAQLGVMYFYAGVVKLSHEWFSGDVFLVNIEGSSNFETLTPLFSSPPFLMFTAVGGALFDLLITPLLWWRRTRLLGVVALIAFHGINSVTLDLGLLPVILLAITLVTFTSPERAASLVSKFEPHPSEPPHISPVSTPRLQNLTLALLCLGLAFHLAFPLRYLTYPGDAHWHGHGRAGAWWLRSFSLKANAKFYVSGVDPDGASVSRQKVDVLSYIHSHQDGFVFHPYTVVAFAHVVADDLRARGWSEVSITSDLDVTLNRRARSRFVPDDVDLSKVPLERDMTDFVLPAPPPRRAPR